MRGLRKKNPLALVDCLSDFLYYYYYYQIHYTRIRFSLVIELIALALTDSWHSKYQISCPRLCSARDKLSIHFQGLEGFWKKCVFTVWGCVSNPQTVGPLLTGCPRPIIFYIYIYIYGATSISGGLFPIDNPRWKEYMDWEMINSHQ